MKSNGKAENVLEQLLWAYAMGCARDPITRAVVVKDEPLQLTLTEATAMYKATSGVTPRREDVQKWLGSVNQFLHTVTVRES